MIKQEVKGQLAKLLATEDLIVEHKSVETAAFNVHTRVLTLPKWDKASNNVYDMLVGHEVGHALYTPDLDWWKERKIHPSFVNIVEDARIEKLMKRKYAGISKSFYNGYRELSNQDFFEVEGKDINEMNLADKANLYFKIGSFVDIDFTVEEMIHITNIDHCETFEEVLDAAERLFKYCEQQLEDKKNEESLDSNVSSGGRPDLGKDSTDYEDMSDEEMLDEVNSDSPLRKEDGEESTGEFNQGGVVGRELEVETADSLAEALKGLTDKDTRETVYFELPKVDLKKIIVSNEEIHDNCEQYWNNYVNESERDYETIFGEIDDEFLKFKRSAQKEVNYLVKEFECKKSASAYARATTAKTGVLDTSKLHTYKFNEDLFKKVTIIPDGKNHGLIFILDWSGSMASVLQDTIKQLYNLLWFCKKVQIPFEVYAFTNEYPHPEVDEDNRRVLAYEPRSGLAAIKEWFSLMNLFTHKTNAKELEKQMIHIWRIASACSRSYYSPFDLPIGMHLSGTPLNESLVCLHEIIPQFKTVNNIDKVQCVVLTDGEAHGLTYHRTVQRPWDEDPFLGEGNICHGSFLRNRKTGNTYCIDGSYYTSFTEIMLRDLRASFPQTNFIGIRVLANRDAGSFIRNHTPYEKIENIMKTWRKNKSFTLKDTGYHSYFGLSSSALDNDTEFEVKEDATKAQIRSAFKKSLTSKKMNKKVLGEFIELVA